MLSLDKKFKTLDYWAEEFGIPLHVISDRDQFPFRDDFLCLYEENTSRLYFIHGRWAREAIEGWRYFRKEGSLVDYSEKVERTVKKLKQLKSDQGDFHLLTKALRDWNRAYFYTEAVRLEKFKGEKDKKRLSDFRKIAKLRLIMREQAEKILFPYLDVASAELARRNNVNADDLFLYTFSELENLLRKKEKVDRKTISLRKRGYAFWRMNGLTKLVVGRDFEKIKNWVNSRYETRGLKEFRGNIANKGIARGPVQLVLHHRSDMRPQLDNFQKGSILVTEMTRPETITICHRASAIITDEGGITCHAAITARELNKPCIIGTNIATRVLRDGDLVEVDANRGVVKILRRGNQ